MEVRTVEKKIYIGGPKGYIKDGSSPSKYQWTNEIGQAKDFPSESEAQKFIDDALSNITIH